MLETETLHLKSGHSGKEEMQSVSSAAISSEVRYDVCLADLKLVTFEAVRRIRKVVMKSESVIFSCHWWPCGN